jgi:hypothetical protein
MCYKGIRVNSKVRTEMAKQNLSLRKEFEFYIENQAELTKKYNGKYIVIKNQEVIGAFDSEFEAVKKTSEQHELGTFLVQKCEPGKDSYSQTYHSRVIFDNA